MVFYNLQAHEKDAFFALLDEYFASRPEIFGQSQGQSSLVSGSNTNDLASSAASAARRTIASNPETASRMISAGLRSVSNPSRDNSSSNNVAPSPEVSNAIGRVAAASLAFGNRDGSNGKPGPPPAPPRRNPSSSNADSSSNERPPPQVTPIRKFGDVDTSSAKNMFNSLRNSTANKSVVPPPVALPSAFAQKKSSFAPPPVRRVPSSNDSNANAGPPPPPARHQPPAPEPEAEEEEVEEGEWAEAIYDYTDGDAGDLKMRAQQRIKIIERNSEDWWTGELDGKRGLFPASYVTIL